MSGEVVLGETYRQPADRPRDRTQQGRIGRLPVLRIPGNLKAGKRRVRST